VLLPCPVDVGHSRWNSSYSRFVSPAMRTFVELAAAQFLGGQPRCIPPPSVPRTAKIPARIHTFSATSVDLEARRRSAETLHPLDVSNGRVLRMGPGSARTVQAAPAGPSSAGRGKCADEGGPRTPRVISSRGTSGLSIHSSHAVRRNRSQARTADDQQRMGGSPLLQCAEDPPLPGRDCRAR